MAEELRDLERLRNLKGCELQELWGRHFRDEVPKTMSLELFRWEIAWRLQAKVYGELKKRTNRRLRDLTASYEKGADAAPSPAPKLQIGSTLEREWRGVKHTAQVTESGFVHRGKEYRSLSAAARAIAGNSPHWRYFRGNISSLHSA